MCGAVRYSADGIDNMADETDANGTGTAEPIKSTTDLEIEKLTARLDALESENRELKTANQGLWAALHPVQDTAEPVAVAQKPANDGAYEAFASKIGLKEKD